MDKRIAFTGDRAEITKLWQAVFGDTAEDIAFFLDNCVHKRCLGAFAEGGLVSMLFLVECEYCSKSGAYIYAVCTAEKYRKQGLCALLINKAKSLGYDFLWLIPADEKLFGYYSKFGFETKLFSQGDFDNTVSFDETEEIASYLYEGSEFEYPDGMIFSQLDLPRGGTGLKKQ